MAKKIELLHTTYDESGNIESQEVVHPLTSPDCIIMENGKTLDEVMGDGIATPTLTHEGTSFKVGVGDSNIEVVDGDVAGMTIKGQSYQNILPKPTTLIMETDEKEFKINDKIDSNIIIDDNIAEIATVKGKTIVNAVQEESGSEYTVLGEDLSGQSIVHVKNNGLENLVSKKNVYIYEDGNAIDYLTDRIEPNTTYTIIFESSSYMYYGFTADTGGWNSENGHASVNGKHKKLLTTGASKTYSLRFRNDEANLTVRNVVVLKGDHTGEDIEYFESDESNIKGVTLQGQTLVNAIQEPCKDDYVVLGADDGNLAYDTIIKPSTLYTVRFKRNIVNADNPLTVDLGGTTQTVTSTEFTITTPSTLTHNQLVFSGKNNVVSEVQVIEGDVTNIEYPYFEGMNDVQVSKTCNLFDINDTVPGYFTNIENEAIIITPPDCYNLVSNYIKVKPNTTYIYNHSGYNDGSNFNWTGMYFFTDDKGTVSKIETTRKTYTGKEDKFKSFTFTTPSDCEYIRIGSRGLSLPNAWATLHQVDNFEVMKVTGKNLCCSLPYRNYCGLEFKESNNSETTVNGTLTAVTYWDYYIFDSVVGDVVYEHYQSLFDNMEVGQTLHLHSNLTNQAHYISIKSPTSNSTIYGRNSYTKRTSDDKLCGGFIRFNERDTFTNQILQVQVEIGAEPTPYEPRHEVIVQQDIDSIPLTSDMFEQGNIASGKIVGMSYQQLNHNTETVRVKSKTLIPIKPNGKYIIQNLNKTNNRLWGWQYDKNGGYLSSIGNTDAQDVFQFDSKAHYITFVLCNQNDSVISPSDLDSMNLVLQEVPQEIVLRGIGDVKDELDLTRGEYIQRIVEYVFDEKYKDKNVTVAEFDSVYRFGIYMSDNLDNSYAHRAKFDKFITNTDYEGDFEHAYYWNATYYFFINKDKVSGGTSAAFKEYIKNNPITTHSVIKTPIIHKVNLTNTKVIQSYATETHYETITPSDSLIPNITIPSTLNYNVAIKPSTEYTIRANTSDNLTVDLGGATGTLSSGKVTLTTPATLTHNEVKFSGTGKVKELMVVEGNEIKDNVPFFNGMKDVQMGGIKLVNIARGATCNNLITANTNKTQFTYTSDGTKWGDVLFDKSLLKQNTLYTIYINVISSNSDNANPLKISMGDDLNTWLNVSSTGLFKQTFTTNDNISNLFGINFRPCTSGQKVVIQNPMIIEGDWTHLDEIPFIESEMIIEQPIIRSQGENLLDLETKYFNPSNVTYTKGGVTYTVTGNTSNYNYGQFAWTTADSWFRKLLGKEVTLSVSSISCTNANSKACIQVRMECTNGLKVFKTISINDSIKYITFTIPSNAIDMALQLMSNNTGSPLDSESTLTVSNIQLVLGNTAASYRAYRHQTLYSNRVIGYEEGCYYSSSSGTRLENNSYTSVLADVDGLEIAYVTGGSSNYTFFDKDGVFISGRSYLNTARTDNQNGFIIVPSNAKYMRFACGNGNDKYTPYTRATVTGELPLRSLPNGVCDTLNLVTGEYVQRVGEIVLDGINIKPKWIVQSVTNNITSYFDFEGVFTGAKTRSYAFSDKFVYEDYLYNDDRTRYTEGIRIGDEGWGSIRIFNSRLETPDYNGFVKWLQQNPITVQYELATPIVRKLGFTTKGNYSQANLATDCEWGASPTTANNTFTTRYRTKSASSLPIVYNTHLFSNDFPIRYFNIDAHQDYEYISNMEYGQYVNVRRDKLEADTPEAFSKWLQHNPIEVGYITWKQSSESYSNIHKPIFFNNVNVQFLPHNVDIQPELTYQVRTRNSYVMDMMKPNTTYTMKCLAYSNSAKLYVANSSANTSVSSNKTLQFAQSHLYGSKNGLVLVGQWYEPMIIEGDVTGKNLPYFKGILSSYHDVDEVEIYSVNKNLFDMSKVKPYDETGAHSWDTIIKENEVVSVRSGNIEAGQFGAYVTLDVRPNSTYTLYIEMEKDGEPFNGQIYGYENDDLWGNGTFTGYANTPYHLKTSHNAKYITIGLNYGKDFPIGTTFVSKNMRLYLGEESPIYIPHAHNTTRIEMPTRLETVKVVRPELTEGGLEITNGAECTSTTEWRSNFIPVQPNEFIKVRNGSADRLAHIDFYDINKNFISYSGVVNTTYVPDNCYFIRFFMSKSACSDLTITRQAYKPIQLNSLPNGVCDEIIMKPNSNKAQLVQRVGKVVLDGNAPYYKYDINSNAYCQWYTYLPNAFATYVFSDTLPTFTERTGILGRGISGKGGTGYYVWFNIESAIATTESVIKAYLQQNPITVYYELATPIIHEIQLKGYPHVYEDGTVALNTDTPHQTLVSYNVNQEQLINTQNETIIRHDQQIDDLYYYIEIYLEEIYQMELFRIKLELSL